MCASALGGGFVYHKAEPEPMMHGAHGAEGEWQVGVGAGAADVGLLPVPGRESDDEAGRVTAAHPLQRFLAVNSGCGLRYDRRLGVRIAPTSMSL